MDTQHHQLITCETSLIWTPLGQKKVSLLVRCPDFRGCNINKVFGTMKLSCLLNKIPLYTFYIHVVFMYLSVIVVCGTISSTAIYNVHCTSRLPLIIEIEASHLGHLLMGNRSCVPDMLG